MIAEMSDGIGREMMKIGEQMSSLLTTPRGFPNPVAEALPEAVARLAAELNPEQVILFGSHAYGTPTPDSDVDLLVILDTDASATERYLAVSRLLYPRPFPADILVRTPAEIEKALNANDFFIREIVSQGRVLYERTH
jgi:predicted nucleotidyltransferase